jgi:flagellar basal body-associated protein FliL
MKQPDDEPKVWVTVIKLIVVAVVIIGGTGLALWYVGEEQAKAGRDPATSGKLDWGISTDSPIHRLH